MPKPIAVLCALLLCAVQFASAQNHGNIQGKIIDSANHEPMDFATVAVVSLKDSSLISYTLTSKGGTFALHNLPAGIAVKLVVSFVSYHNYRKEFMLSKGQTFDFGTISLGKKNSTLKEVTITADAAPVVMKKDTIEFSAEAFKTPPNAVVEELLRRLPGVQVDMDGTITVNGKKVTKLLIDGKRFFVNDTRIATKNLDAALISKIQVYDDREDDPDHLIPDSRVEKIINLKLKAAVKRNSFGKLHATGGTRDRWGAGLLYNQMRDTLQASLILVGNNLNSTGFDGQDMATLGGFDRSKGDGYNTGIETGGSNYGGIQTAASAGLNINNDYGKKLKLNLLYFYSYTKDVNNTSLFTQELFSDTTLFKKVNDNNSKITNKHNLSGLVEWKPDSTISLRYQPKIIFTQQNNQSGGDVFSYNNLVNPLNTTVNGTNNNQHTFQFQHSLSYHYQKQSKGSSFTVSHNLNITPDNTLEYNSSILNSYTTVIPSGNFSRLSDQANKNTSANLDVTYRYPFNKQLTGAVGINTEYKYSHGRNFMYDENLQTGQYNIYIDSLSRDLIRNQITETIHPELRYKMGKNTSLTLTLNTQFMQTLNTFHKGLADINRHETFFVPGISFSSNGFYLDYSSNITQPGISDMIPYRTIYSQLYSYQGNPNLQATRTHNIYTSYQSHNNDKNLSFNINGRFNIDEHAMIYRRTINSQGITESAPENHDGNLFGYLGFGISKGFKKMGKWQLRYSPRVFSYYAHGFYHVNDKEGFQNTYSVQLSQQFFASWDNKVDFNASVEVAPRITNYQNSVYPNVSIVNRSFSLPVNVRGVKHWIFEASYNYSYNALQAQGFQHTSNIINLSVTHLFQANDRGEIKLSCYDLLNQNIDAYRYAYGNAITDMQSLILKRYFSLGYAYRFNKAVTKK